MLRLSQNQPQAMSFITASNTPPSSPTQQIRGASVPLHLQNMRSPILTIHQTRPSRLAQITTSADQMPISHSNNFTLVDTHAWLYPGLVASLAGEQALPSAQSRPRSLSKGEKWGIGAQTPCSRVHPQNCIIVYHTPDVRENLEGWYRDVGDLKSDRPL